MRELSKTLKHYKNTYKSRLVKYLNDYEDNTELLFIQKELNASHDTLETLKTNSKQIGWPNLIDVYHTSTLKNSGFNLDKIDNHIASVNKIISFLKQQQENVSAAEKSISKITTSPSKTENYYPHIFKNPEAFQFFQKLHEHFKESEYELANYSFIYRKMYEEGYILDTFKPKMYMEWIAKEPFCKYLDKVKTIYSCSTQNKTQSYYLIHKSLK